MTTAIQPLGPLSGLSCAVTADLSSAQDGLHALRTLLTADIVRRLIESFLDGQATIAINDTDRYASLKQAADALWIPTPTHRWARPDIQAGPPTTTANITVTITHLAGASDGPYYPVGPVTSPAGSVDTLLGAWEPLDIRLALLRFRHADSAELSKARLYRAHETMRRWRVKIAQWAHLPSAPSLDPQPFIGPLLADLDTTGTLLSLHHLETDHTAVSGSKLETFLLIDRVLGLNLEQLIGKL